LVFDHVPEKGEKKEGVAHISSLATIRYEASKCNLVCLMCHDIITHSKYAENSTTKTYPKLERKRKYVNDLKVKIGGCVLCGFFDKTILPYFQFDHIDPSTKVADISTIIVRSYSEEELYTELSKCRLLCGFCHRQHSTQQLKRWIKK
jgi:hypothetical protein